MSVIIPNYFSVTTYETVVALEVNYYNFTGDLIERSNDFFDS